jgi:hypothetical protein
MLAFGSGYFYGISTAANSSPRKFAKLQDVQFDLSFSNKSLLAQGQLPIDIRRGQGKFTGKAKAAEINAGLLNDLFFAQSQSTGLILSAVGESGQIPATTTYIVTTVNSVTWTQDLGVVYAATGVPFTRVATSPTVGQYSVAAGVYTFAAADAGLAVYIDYLYTSASGGNTISLSNQQMGTTPTFTGIFTTTVSGKNLTLILNQLTSSKLSLQSKNEDYTIPELDFEVMADAANNIGKLSITT